MSTFIEIQDAVETNLIDLPTAVVNSVPGLINAALRTIQRKYNFWVMQGSQQYATVEGQRALAAVPSDFKAFRGDAFYTTDAGDQQKIIVDVEPISFSRAIGQEDVGPPMWLVRGEPDATGASTMQVWPIPDGFSDYSDGEYVITMPYWRYLPALSADADTNWFTVNASEYIEYQATADGFAKDWDEERMALWAQRAENKYREIVMEDKKLRWSAVTTWVPNWQGANQPPLRS